MVVCWLGSNAQRPMHTTQLLYIPRFPLHLFALKLFLADSERRVLPAFGTNVLHVESGVSEYSDTTKRNDNISNKDQRKCFGLQKRM